MIVVDSNIIAYLYLPDRHTAAASSLFARDSNWAVPFLWRSEFRNVLAGCMRRKTVTFDQAIRLQRAAAMFLKEGESEVESKLVLELVRDSDCSAYDCEFVALAIELNTSLVTMDKKILRAFPQRAVAL